MTGHPHLFQIHQSDNVAVALDGEKTGHKFALRDIHRGEKVIKYGMPIGVASTDIRTGEQVHTNNLKTCLDESAEYLYEPLESKLVPAARNDFFEGFQRPNGEVGVRNDLWIIPLVGCVNRLAETLAAQMRRILAEHPESTVGTTLALTHPYGCSQLGEDHQCTADVLASLCKHPNAGGVLVVALGCENNTLESFRERLGDISAFNIQFLRAQDSGNELVHGMELLKTLYWKAAQFQRHPSPVSSLKVGLKCGGSDGFSGITANPLAGRFCDLLIGQGGSGILTEVPEMFGAETLLMNRCKNREVFDKCVHMIVSFKQYFTRHGQTVYENPSPGNKDGGISTLEDKSLGCVQKAGTSPVNDVLNMAERIRTPGLNLLDGPGNDMVASTLLAAAGCQLILFTTGRGTPFGSVVPTIKISSNSALARKKTNWIDFDAGRLLSEENTREELGDELFTFVLNVASGHKLAKNEEYGYQEIALFKNGVTL